MRYNLNAVGSTELKQLSPADIDSMAIPPELKAYCIMILQRIDLMSHQIDELDASLHNVSLEDQKFKILLTLPGAV
jgi:hypothetical protein